MNILFTRFPYESAYGGAEVQTLSLMKELKERGHNISFLGSCSVLLDQTAKCKIKNVKCKIGPPPVTKWNALSFFWRKRHMQKKLIESLQTLQATSYKLQAVCMLSLSEKLLLTSYAVQHGINVFWIEHDTVGRWLRWNLWLPRLRKVSRLAITITVSELSRTLYLDLGWDPEKIVAIPNGVPSPGGRGVGRGGKKNVNETHTHLFEHQTSSPQSPPAGRGRPFRIGCVSRLSPEKGIDLLIDAVKEIPSTSLTIVGRGREARRINKLTNKQINLTSWIPNITDFYHSLDILVLPSRTHDPFGLVAAEAMMNGVPVIITNACGIAGYLKNETDALVVPANSAQALREAIIRMQNKELRMKVAKNGQQTAIEKFSVERMVDEYENILNSEL